MATGPLSKENSSEIVKFSEQKPAKNTGPLLVWLAAIISLVITGYFWYADSSVKKQIAAREADRQKAEQQVDSSVYKNVETKTLAFQSAVAVLKDASSKRYSLTDFLPAFYQHINNDVQISNLSISETGQISFQGLTKSYRSVADQILALKSWPALSDVKVGSISIGTGTDSAATARFSIVATLVKTVSPSASAATAETTTSTDTSDTTTSSSTTTAPESPVSANIPISNSSN